MLKHIFVDVDDTLNQFTMNALRLMGCSGDYPVDVGYDIVAACNRLLPAHRRQTGPHEFWASLPEEAWSEAPLSLESSWLLNECVKIVGQENVFLCTSTSHYPSSLSGKLKWIHRYLPTWIHRQYVITPHKYLLARPNTLLIDDCYDQFSKFVQEGGQAFLVPKPWNPNHTWDTEEYLRASLAPCRG